MDPFARPELTPDILRKLCLKIATLTRVVHAQHVEKGVDARIPPPPTSTSTSRAAPPPNPHAEDLDRLQDEITRLDTALATAEDNAQLARDAHHAALATAREEAERVRTEITALHADLTQERARTSSSTIQRDVLRRELAQAKSHHDDQIRHLTRTHDAERSALRVEVDELLAQKSMWEEDRATYERAAASHRDQIAVWEEKWEEEQEKVAALETRLVTTTNQVRAMEIDAARARAAAEALQARCDELMNIEVEVQRVRAEASEARAAAAARGVEKEVARARVIDLEAQLVAGESRWAASQAELATAREAMGAMRAEMRERVDEYTRARDLAAATCVVGATIAKKESENRETETENMTETATDASTDQERRRTTTTTTTTTTEVTPTPQPSLDGEGDMTTRVAKLLRENASLKRQIGNLTVDLVQTQTAATQWEQTRRQAQREANLELQRVRDDLVALQAQYSEKEQALATACLRATSTDAELVSAREASRQDLRAQHDTHTQRLATLVADHARTLEKTHAAHSAAVARWEKEREDIRDRHRDELAQLASDRASLEAEYREARTQLQQLERQHGDMVREKARLESDVSQARAELAARDARAAEAKASRDLFEEETKLARAECEQAWTARSHAERASRDAAVRIAELLESRADLQAQLEILRKEATRHAEAQKRWEMDTEARGRQVAADGAALRDLRESLLRAQRDTQKAQRETTHAQEARRASDRRTKELEDELQQTREAHEASEGTWTDKWARQSALVSTLENAVGNMTTGQTEWVRQRRALDQELTQTREAVREKEKEVDRLSRALAQREAELARVQTDLTKQQAKQTQTVETLRMELDQARVAREEAQQRETRAKEEGDTWIDAARASDRRAREAEEARDVSLARIRELENDLRGQERAFREREERDRQQEVEQERASRELALRRAWEAEGEEKGEVTGQEQEVEEGGHVGEVGEGAVRSRVRMVAREEAARDRVLPVATKGSAWTSSVVRAPPPPPRRPISGDGRTTLSRASAPAPPSTKANLGSRGVTGAGAREKGQVVRLGQVHVGLDVGVPSKMRVGVANQGRPSSAR